MLIWNDKNLIRNCKAVDKFRRKVNKKLNSKIKKKIIKFGNVPGSAQDIILSKCPRPDMSLLQKYLTVT